MNIKSCFRLATLVGILSSAGTAQSQTGSILREYWSTINGVTVASLTNERI